jgi:glycine cleavage system aminomethyltransferase T
MDALRLQKSHHLIPRKMSIEYPAFESGLGRLSRLDKDADARGSEAAGAGPGANRVA